MDTPDLGVQEMLAGHTQATLARIRAHAVVWLGQETTFLNDGTTHPKAGMGTVKSNTREAYLPHPPVVCTPERGNFGGAGMNVWQRPEPPVAQPRQHTPMAAKESYRGLEG